MENRHRICGLFAELIDYPRPQTAGFASDLAGHLDVDYPEAGRPVEIFHGFAAATPPDRLEELYTLTFDLQPQCCPYLGYHLCGEGYQRSRFLIGLQEVYRAHGFTAQGELADHYREVLRFMSHVSDERIWLDLAADGLLPALHKGLEGISADNPYGSLLGALKTYLEQTVGSHDAPALEEEIAP